MTEIASLKISVDARDASSAAKEMAKMAPEAAKAEKAVGKLSTASKEFGSVIGGLAAALAGGVFFQAVIRNTIESESALAQLSATIKSTGGAAGLSSDQVVAMAQGLQKVTTFGDDAIISMASQLLTFDKIGGESVPRATEAILDLATKMNGDLKGAALQVGKALNDPVQGINALTRSGVSFSEAQKEVIRSLVETGDVAGAQAVILSTLEGQMGGSARAARETFGGAVTALQNAFGDLLEGSGGNLNDAREGVESLTKALSDPQVQMAFSQIVGGIFQVTTAVANALPKLTAFTTWAAQELAAAFSGAAIGDLPRLMEELADLERKAATDRERNAGGELRRGLEQELALTRTKIQLTEEMDFEAERQKALAADLILLQQQQTKETKTFTGATTGKIAKSRELATETDRAAASNARVITDLAESIYQASLSAEQLAKRQAELRLNQYATPEQIESVRKLSAELQKIKDIEDRKKEFGSDVSGAIRGNVPPLSGGEFDNQMERYDAERQAEELRYQEQQIRLNEALQLELITRQQYAGLEVELAQVTADRMAQINKARNDMMLTSMSSAFGQMSSDLMAFSKTFADENSAMFKVAKAAAIAQTIIQTYQGAQQAFTSLSAIPVVGPALGAAAAAAAIAGGMARVSAISSQGMASFEGGGFTGTGSRSGGMDGKGGFMAMVHPNETIIDHTKSQSAGGSGVTVNVIQSSEKAGTQETKQNADGSQSVDVFVSDIYGDGPRARALQNAFGLKRSGK